MNRAVFLDRDGTINVDKEYLYRISDFEFIPGAKEALLSLQKAGLLLVVVTNQSGIARGYYSENDLAALNSWMLEALAREGIFLSGIYYCPHHPEGNVEAYRLDCDCRKPKLGLFYRAAAELDIDIGNSFAVGDRERDLQICASSGCKGYLIDSADTDSTLPGRVKRVPNLAAAVRYIADTR